GLVRNVTSLLMHESKAVDDASLGRVDRHGSTALIACSFSSDLKRRRIETVPPHVRNSTGTVHAARQRNIRVERNRITQVMVHKRTRQAQSRFLLRRRRRRKRDEGGI